CLHQSLRRTVVSLRAFLAFDDRQQACGQFLAKFDTPLVEGVDPEQNAFDENAVLVERYQAAKRKRRQLIVKEGDRGAVAREDAMRGNEIRLALLHSL